MPTGMNERQARLLARRIEAEDARVKAIAQRCASENPWYVGKTWQVMAVLKQRNLKQPCFRLDHWTSIKIAWDELCREEH